MAPYLPILLVTLTLTKLANGVEQKYDGHEVWTIIPETSTQLAFLIDLQHHAHKYELDFWREPTRAGDSVMVRVSPNRRAEIRGQMTGWGLRPRVTIDNVQRAIDRGSTPHSQDLQTDSADFGYSLYHPLEELNSWMQNMEARFPDRVSLFTVATSYENRNITVMKITGTKSNNTKPGFFLNGGMHAREWISPSTVIYMSAQLIEQYNTTPAITQLVDAWDWYVLPVLNVDGYVYSWTTDRLWRKNRSKHSGKCVGVDPNRNWNWKWAEKGASRDPCSGQYCGPSAESEPEVKGLADFLLTVPGRFRAFVDFHGFGQAWLTPWGSSRAYPAKFVHQNQCSRHAVRALKAAHGTDFRHGAISLTLYMLSGGSVDWAYGVAKIPYPAIVELRDTGKHGFLLPEDQIIPSGEETLRGIMAMARYVLRNP